MKPHAILRSMLALFLVFFFVSVPKAQEMEGKTLYIPRGPSLFTVASLKEGLTHGPSIALWRKPEEIAALFASSKAQCAVLPVTLGAALHHKGIPMVLLGVTQWDLFSFLLGGDSSFSSLEDLRGKTVYMPISRGTTADTLLRASLEEAGVTPDVAVRLVYAPPQEIVGLLAAGKASYGVLPEPFTTLALTKSKVRSAFPLVQLWQKKEGKEAHLPVAGIFVTRKAHDADPKGFQEMVLQYRHALEWAKGHPGEVAIITKKEMPLPEKVLQRAFENCNVAYHSGQSVRSVVSAFYQFLCHHNPDSCKGSPGVSFFYP